MVMNITKCEAAVRKLIIMCLVRMILFFPLLTVVFKERTSLQILNRTNRVEEQQVE